MIPLALVFAEICLGQGIATANLPPLPRAKASSLPFDASFTDIAREAGLTARFIQGHPLRKKYIIEANGTGVAFLDFNNDGRLDVFLVNGSRIEPFPKGQEPTNHLYENLGRGKFRDVTRSAGIGRSGWGNGVCSGDFDNDGNEDLYVTYWGVNSLFRNKGDGTFNDIAVKAGVAGSKDTWSTGCTFLDYDRDGFLDLFVASYVEFDSRIRLSRGSIRTVCFATNPSSAGLAVCRTEKRSSFTTKVTVLSSMCRPAPESERPLDSTRSPPSQRT